MRFYLLLVSCLYFSCSSEEQPLPSTEEPEGDSDSLYFPPTGTDEWETISIASLGWNESGLTDLDNFISNTNTRALLILKGGRMVIERYAGKDLKNEDAFQQNNYWYWASAAKTLTAFLIGRAASQGFLSLDDPSHTYLGQGWSSMLPAQEDAVLIRNHLTMTTGLDYGVSNPDCTNPDCMEFLHPPNQQWYYHNAPYTILDQVLEGATSETFDTYFNTELKDKIGMEGFWAYSGFNHIFYSPPRSMARFGLLMLAKGNWDGAPILENPTFYDEMITSSQELNPSYGYLWWLNGKDSFIPPATTITISQAITPDAPSDLFAAVGKNGQLINIVPSQQLVIVRMGEGIDDVLVPLSIQNQLWESINKLIVN